jgi:ABC-2 type transport system permease protein
MTMWRMTLLRREVLTIWRDRSLRYILLFGALIAVLLFLAIYSAQVIKAIPTAIVDLDHSDTSLELTDYIRNTEYLRVVAYPGSFDDLDDLIRQGRVVTGIVIPENYGRDVSLGRQTRLLAIIDGSNMIYATNASSAILTIARTIGAGAGIRTLVAHGVQYGDAEAAYQTIDFREDPWYNPALNYAYFLVLALVLNIWQQCCTLAACMTVAGETGRAPLCLQGCRPSGRFYAGGAACLSAGCHGLRSSLALQFSDPAPVYRSLCRIPAEHRNADVQRGP